MPKSRPPKPAPAPDALKRERAGTYRSNDGRFTVEQSSSGWMVIDAEQTDGLGLPLTRGPFPTLDDAKAAMAEARSGATPTGARPKLRVVRDAPTEPAQAAKAATAAKPVKAAGIATAARTAKAAGAAKAAATAPPDTAAVAAKPAPEPAPKPAPKPVRPPIVIRDLRTSDGDALRKLWAACGLKSLGDDDRSLARMARRNPGLVLVAVEGTRIVASALAGWDGRRGWIYHVATAESHRRQGIATRLLDQVEAALAVLGAPKVNVLVQAGNAAGRALWEARGYAPGTAEQFGKEL